VNTFLTARFKQATQKLSKMASLVEMSSHGNLSSFTGVFRVGPLNSAEKETLSALLSEYKNETQEIEEDLLRLADITAEVKAINNQAILLHGERIEKVQSLLKNYRDGAFSAWLIATYGNRQTPYNFWQYYKLFLALPEPLQSKLDEMPRQAIYTLASRTASMEEKQEIVAQYRGEPKEQLLKLIRKTFPLSESDKRARDDTQVALALMKRLSEAVCLSSFRPTKAQREQLLHQLKKVQAVLDGR
jgi:hypothetical protein